MNLRKEPAFSIFDGHDYGTGKFKVKLGSFKGTSSKTVNGGAVLVHHYDFR